MWLTLLPLLLLSPWAIPAILRLLALLVGSYIRHRTFPRRQLLLTKAQDKAELSARNHHEPPVDREDQDWERVEKNVIRSAPNGLAVDDDWSGIIGFFHPFWYVLKFTV
jgi:alpha-1,2-mannosyltransferase